MRRLASRTGTLRTKMESGYFSVKVARMGWALGSMLPCRYACAVR